MNDMSANTAIGMTKMTSIDIDDDINTIPQEEEQPQTVEEISEEEVHEEETEQQQEEEPAAERIGVVIDDIKDRDNVSVAYFDIYRSIDKIVDELEINDQAHKILSESIDKIIAQLNDYVKVVSFKFKFLFFMNLILWIIVLIKLF